jgi:hypothetical protein
MNDVLDYEGLKGLCVVLGRPASTLIALVPANDPFAIGPLRRAISKKLRVKAPDIDEIDWPEPEQADEDDDPLFDPTRDYVDQIDRYKHHQGKPTVRRGRNGGPP